jgi:hypothetical protein
MIDRDSHRSVTQWNGPDDGPTVAEQSTLGVLAPVGFSDTEAR